MTSPDSFWRMAWRDAYYASHPQNSAAQACRLLAQIGGYADDTEPAVLEAGELLTLSRLTRFAFHYWSQADVA